MRSRHYIILLVVWSCTAPHERVLPRTPPNPEQTPGTVSAPSATARAAVPRPLGQPGLSALASDAPFIELEVEGAKPVVVSLPLGSTTARPVLVATHGAGARATVHCAMWRGIVGDRDFIVCPRGTAMWPYDPPHESGYFYDGHPALGVEIAAVLQALGKAYPKRADLHAPVFAGYSQGANMGALLLPEHDAKFAHAILWEGGVGEFQEWNVRTSRLFHAHGGTRILFACGRPVCNEAARRTMGYMKRGGLDARLIYEPSAGHSYGGKLGERVREAFAWLVKGDARWISP